MSDAIRCLKTGKAAGADGIYPEMLTHLGKRAISWLAKAMTDIINKSSYPKQWKQTHTVTILKPGKPSSEPGSYRPISLLCCTYKLLERVILTRITPILDPHIPIEQAGFRQGRSTTEQTLALTSYIEAGFEKNKKTGVIFIDLSAAYDTVWRDGLMLKMARKIKCRKMLKLLSAMTGTRQLRVHMGADVSNTMKLKNGVPQGSVLAPTLFNTYIADMPNTKAHKFGYADDWALAYQSERWEHLEETLGDDGNAIKDYFDRWYLEINMTKTVATAFHLDNHQARRALSVNIAGQPLPSDEFPKYLGVTLDRSLTYKRHIETTSQKLSKRNNIIGKLAGTRWGASQSVFRTSALALCYSVAEYCSPVWSRSAHAKKIDVKLNEAMRTISGSTKSTPTAWLPVMSAIAPPHLRREGINQRWFQRVRELADNIPLKQIVNTAPTSSRLKSRKPFYKSEQEQYCLDDAWRREWQQLSPRGCNLVQDPTTPLPGFDSAKRRYWTAANRLRSGHGRTAVDMHRWKLWDSPICPRCQLAPQDTDHLVLQCPDTLIQGSRPLRTGSTIGMWRCSHTILL